MSQHFDHVVMTVSGTPGTGNITHGAAAPGGYRALAATVDGVATNGQSFDLELFEPSGPHRSVELNCVYNSTTGVLTRGTVSSSTTGSRLSLTSAAIVSVTDHAALGNKLDEGFAGAVQASVLNGVETAITDAAIVSGDSLLTAIRKLIARCANALSRSNHTGTQAISTVTNLQTTLDAKPPKPEAIELATAVVITSAYDNVTFNTGATTRAITVSAGIPVTFSGITVDGPCTWAAAGGVTITDSRVSGAGYNHCTLVLIALNTYRLVGVTL
jgi:hypothetical protein